MNDILEAHTGLLRRAVLESVDESDNSDAFAKRWKNFLVEDRPPVDISARTLNTVDLFSSVGGLSLGFAEAARALNMRTRTQLAVDVDEDALHVFNANHHPRQALHRSVADLVDFRVVGRGSGAHFAFPPRPALDSVQRLVGKVDVVLAGPPCQGHSSLNNRSRGDDPRNLLYLTVPAVAIALDAKAVIIENVPNVVRDKDGVVDSTVALFERAGYSVTAAVLAADKLGWAQSRRRFFLVATKQSAPTALNDIASSLERAALPLSWAIGDLAANPLLPMDVMSSVPTLSAENRARVEWLLENDEYNLPNALRPDCHRDGNHTYSSSYGRMHWDQPAGTITGGFMSPGRGRYVHPLHPRVLTPREAARVQGFPDWFAFRAPGLDQPNRSQLAKWIGDAVPPILGYTAGLAALSTLG